MPSTTMKTYYSSSSISCLLQSQAVASLRSLQRVLLVYMEDGHGLQLRCSIEANIPFSFQPWKA